MSRWKQASAYVAGRSHIKEDLPCQDRTICTEHEGMFMIALADGAGSAKRSDIGAEATLQTLTAYIGEHYDKLMAKDPGEISEELVGVALTRLTELAEEQEQSLGEFSSTLLFAAVKDKIYLAGHLGDGLIAVEKEEGLGTLSHPENGEYANSTYFTTSKDAASHLRIYKGELDEIQAFFLMSDGTAETMHRKQDDTLAPALKVISGWFDEHPVETLTDALHKNLENVIRQRTMDDCSMAIMKRMK